MQLAPVNNINHKNFKGFFQRNNSYERLLKEADYKTIKEFNRIKTIAEKTNDNIRLTFEPEEITPKTSYIDLVAKNLQTNSRTLIKTVYLLRGASIDNKLENPLENFLQKLKDLYPKT